MGRFAQTFNWLFSRLPFSDEARVTLRVWAEALRRELCGPTASGLNLQDQINNLYDAAFISTASGVDLNEWGAVLGLERETCEADVNYGVECFGPVTDYIRVAYAASLDVTTQLTVDIRFKVDNLAAHQDLYSRNAGHQELRVLNTGAITWNPLPAVIATSAAATVVPGSWYHLRAIYDNVAGAEVYLGQAGGVFTLIAAAAAAGLMTAGAWPIRIGQRFSGINPLNGVVDEIRAVAGVIATVSGVTEVPECLTAETGTKMLLHCDEGTGAVALDVSGFGNNGALQGNADWYSMVATGWPGYQARVLAEWRTTFAALTVQAISDAVDAVGALYLPPISTVRVHEYYRPYWAGAAYGRREDGVDPADAVSLGDSWGLTKQDRSTFGVEINRSPSAAEALALAAAIQEVKLGFARGHVIADMGLPLPPRYRAFAEAYSAKQLAWAWDDNFLRGVGAVFTDRYNNVVGAGAGWIYTGTTLQGVAGMNNPLADVLVPRQDLPAANNYEDTVVIDEKNIYVAARAMFTLPGGPVGAADFAGFVFRYQDLTDEFYAIVFQDPGTGWEWSIQRFTGAAWVVEKAWAATGIDMGAAFRDVEIWIRGDTLITVRIDGVVLATEYDVGPDIITAGEFGFVTAQAAIDMEVDEYRYW
jgi:hypothetical protein